MFTRIARRYDLMNRADDRRAGCALAAGGDPRGRGCPPAGGLLDLGAGTGDLAREALRQHPDAAGGGGRFHPGDDARRARHARCLPPLSSRLAWCAADAPRLPFPDRSFRRGGLRLPAAQRDRPAAAPGRTAPRAAGRAAGWWRWIPPRRPRTRWRRSSASTCTPSSQLGPAADRAARRLHLPARLDRKLPGSPSAWRCAWWRPVSSQVGFQRRMFGTMAIHWGCK